MIKNVRGIHVKLELEGQGIVNCDGDQSKYLYMNSVNTGDFDSAKNDNMKFGKAVYMLNPDSKNFHDKYVHQNMFSGPALRHAIHAEAIPFQTPAMFDYPEIRQAFIASLDGLLRGAMYAPSKNASDTEGFKRKSPYTITDAIEDSGSISSMQMRTSLSVDSDGKRSDTSLFCEETKGKTHYTAQGYVDMKLLEIIPASANADRKGMCEGDLDPVIRLLKEQFEDEQVSSGLYSLTGSQSRMAEKAILLGSKAVQKLVNHLLRKMASIYVSRQSAFVRTLSVQVKFVVDPIFDDFNSPEGWVTVYGPGVAFNEVEFEHKCAYSLSSMEEVEAFEIHKKEFDKRTKDAAAKAKKEKEEKAKKNKNKNSSEDGDSEGFED
jgi:hypothetical protein